MKHKVKWYSKGKWEEDEFETKQDPYIRIVKYNYSDNYSYEGYRYWVVRDNRTLLKNLEQDLWITYQGMSDIRLNKREIELVKSDKIPLTNNVGEGITGFIHYKYSDLVDKYGEESIYF
jgi:hypothetical protein